MKRSPLRRRTPLTSGGRIKPKRRKASEFARIYGSKERVAWVRAQPCVVCRGTPSENMHVRNGGTGRKADARWIVPMCHTHHREAHRIGIASFEDRHFLFLDGLAYITEATWRDR